ncbi:FG-GAP-like repeat-containing protein [Amycolatopsis sp. WQ 127309]|uniref:FG-GAP-like repeat-containing protein n=1 Tax=Amycolatopsis sp. WQ 127309 TaxID=2932773 RepID=UPI001FF4302E|nr:FG-GAP-like repeat-containing protein [Amycolatopsis sp. WQ 127309]UOZ06358.1 FG-GAP-like repeat-containing protein [Amycolatopsis sp. WQ 127309]
MLRRLFVVIALLVSGVFLVPAASAAALGPAVRVMPLGDSITWGVGSATTSSYRAPLARLLAAQSRYSARFVGTQASGSLPGPANEGHSGYTIDQLTAGIDGWLAFDRPDVVLLHVGINDLARGIDVAHAPQRLRTLADRIFADRPGVAVLFLGLIPTTPGLESATASFNSSVKAMQGSEQQAGHRFRYVDPPALTSAEMADNLHPDDAGYQRMAQSLYGPLDQAYTDGWIATHPALGAATEAGGSGKVRWADFDGDGRADYLTVASNGAVSAILNRGGDGHGGWSVLGQVATGTTTDPARARFADFDGDGRADYLTIAANGAVTAFLNRGGDGRGGWLSQGQVATGTTTDQSRVRFADLDGDGRADYLTIAANGAVTAFLNRGGDGRGGWLGQGQVATGTTTDPSLVRFADFDGDGAADYAALATSGAVTLYLNRGGDGHGGWLPYGQVATGLTTTASQVAFADFTGGGNADYVLADPPTNAATVYAWQGGDGHGGWTNLGKVAAGVPIG